MKRIISVFIIVAMMLASVLVLIPASALESATASTNVRMIYNVNWKELVEDGTMRATWIGDRRAANNNMASKYQITATETALKLRKINGDSRAYFSDVMFDITADTQYEYVFKADKTNDDCGDAGVIFAWAPNPNTYKLHAEHFVDGVDDIYPGVPKAAYHIMANWGDHTDYKVQYGGPNDGGYTQFGTNVKPDLYDVLVDEEGFSTYKVVYNGFTVEMYYLDTTEQWVEFFEDKEMVLVEGSKLAFGLNTWSPSHTNLKDCVVYAMNDAAAEAMNAAFRVDKTDFNARLAEAEAYNEADWFAEDWSVFKKKVEEGKAAATAAETAKYQYVMDYATAKLENAILNLNATASEISAKLRDAVATSEALLGSQSLYTEASWMRFTTAFANANSVINDYTASQNELITAYNALYNARKGLMNKEFYSMNTYNVNWRLFFENNALRSQWWYNTDDYNNYLNYYEVTATETLLGSKPIASTENLLYYSTVMFEINEYTYYEYTFEAKNDRSGGYAGIIFAYDTDNFPYFVYGEFDNDSDNYGTADFRYRKGHHERNANGHSSNLSEERHFPVLDLTEDGFGQFKCVYDGYNFSFYAKGEDDYRLIWSYVLPEGSKLAVGVYSRSSEINNRRTMTLRNCEISSYNEKSAEFIYYTVADYLLELAENKLADNYTSETEQAVSDAMQQVLFYRNNFSYVYQIDAAIANLETAILNLKRADKTELNAAIEAANHAIAGKTASYFEELYYTPFAKALANAIAVNDNENSTQDEVDLACADLVYTTKRLVPAGKACKTDLVEAMAKYAALEETDYKPNSWATLEASFATANALNSADLSSADQDTVDAAVNALYAAIESLVKRADFSKLDAVIKRANSLDKSDYITSSWNIDLPLASAKAVSDDRNNDQYIIDEALAALNAAINDLVTWKTNVLAIKPADDYFVNDPAKYGDNPSWYNKITDMSYFGIGNVFYYDYHKVVAAKIADWGDYYEAGTPFPESMESMNWQGNSDYVMRLGTNISGSGTNRVTDGDRLGTAAEHRAAPTYINGKLYSHVFGFSFVKAPTVDSIAVYLPTDTKIVSIDVYGAVRETLTDGTVLYGKADRDAVVKSDNNQCEDSTTVKKIYLGTVNIPEAIEGDDNILATADFIQAMKVEYVYFAIQYAEGTGVNTYYKIYEIELFGIDGYGLPPDFSRFNNAYAKFDALVKEDYTAESWAFVEATIKQYSGAVTNLRADQASIDEAADAIEAAIAALVAKPADCTALDAVIARGALIVASEYTPITYDHFKAALDAAIALRATYNVSQNEVDNATALLNEALSLLVKRADKDALNAAVADGMGLKKIEWCGNAIAWTMFERALSDAVEILADENATQEEVNEMVYILQQRKDNLIRNPGYSDPSLESEKEKIISALGTKKDNSRNTYSQSSYSKYVNAYNSIVSSINSASTLAELEAIDVNALKNSAEALLVLAVDDLSSLREIAFKFMGEKIVNKNGNFTIDSYAEYVSAYDSIIKQINAARDVDSLKALDLVGLKAWAESKLVATDPDEYETENDGHISGSRPETGENIITTEKNDNNDNDHHYGEEQSGGKDGGCFSSIGISALAVIGVIGSALLVKKKEN